jgi:alpha-tubulin suppressor-like RCC1 family protein
MFFFDKAITKISCGFSHIIALTQNNKLYGWGANEDGNCGIPNGDNYILMP